MDRPLGKAATWGMVFLCLLIAGNGILSYRNLQRLLVDVRRTERSRDALFAIEGLFGLAQDAIIAAREYVLIDDASDREAAASAVEKLREQSISTRRFLDDLPQQTERLALVERQVFEVLDFSNDLVRIRNRQGAAAALERIASGVGKAKIDALRDTVMAIKDSQQAILQERSEASNTNYSTALISVVNATAGALVLVGAVYGLVRRDRMERNRAEELLRASEARFRRLFDANVVGVLFSDYDGRVSDANDAFLKMIGYSRSDLAAGRVDWRRLTPEEFKVLDERAIAELKSSGVAAPFEKEYIRQDGSRIACLVAAARLEEPEGACICFAIDLSERKRLEDQLKAHADYLQNEQSWLESLLDLLPVPLLLIEPKTAKTTFANRAAHVMAGGRFPVGAPVGDHESVHDFTDPQGTRITAEDLPGVQTARGERLDGLEVNWHLPDGDRTIIISADTLPPTNGHDAMAVLLFQDITRLKQIQSELRRNNQAKDALLAMLGHELRNPLAAIAGSTELIAVNRPEDPTYQQSLGILRRQIQHLTRLIDDMLDLARLTAGKIRLRLDNVDLARPLASALQTTQALLASRRHELSVELPPHPIVVRGDPARLEQVFTNLVVNAAKYTDPGGRIEVRVAADDGRAVVRIRDNGIGLDPAAIPTLFDLFAQVNPQLDRSQAGLGIGLTVVRSLVELHGGEISAHSAGLARGSEFVIRLPLSVGIATDESAPRFSIGQAEPPVSPLDVLVVEDQPDIARIMLALVERCGHRPHGASTALEALQLARESRPDIAFVDIGLPGMNGYELARCMRAEPLLRTTRLIALTGYGQQDDLRRSQEAGFARHLVKPIDLTTLAQILHECCSDLARKG